MSFWARIRFFFGIVFVVLLVGLLVLYLNNAMSSVRAQKAEIGSDSMTIGVDYPGTVTRQVVNEGDKVHKDEVLFAINSPELASALKQGSVQKSNLPFSIDPQTDNILLKATGDGVVEKINYTQGAYVPIGAVVATIDTANTLYISGHYHLSPPDYARLQKGNAMSVTFPDNGHATATVYSISLTSNGGVVDTVVKARLKGTVEDFRFPVGTPVEASLKLTQRTWFQQLVDFGHHLFKPGEGA